MKFSIIIPCYNEGENITNLINRIRPLQKKYDLEYILIENGSTDDSRQYFQKYVEDQYQNIRIVYVDKNLGYGYGLQQGMKVSDGEYVGWIHADMQMPPEELMKFFDKILSSASKTPLFLKGIRTNRSMLDRFFTNGQSIFNTILFGTKLYDVGAIPVIFHRSLINKIEEMPNDFSIELYVYKEASFKGFEIKRCKVKLLKREKGNSSWNNGLKSKIRQSKKIFMDSIKIKKGEKVR